MPEAGGGRIIGLDQRESGAGHVQMGVTGQRSDKLPGEDAFSRAQGTVEENKGGSRYFPGKGGGHFGRSGFAVTLGLHEYKITMTGREMPPFFSGNAQAPLSRKPDETVL